MHVRQRWRIQVGQIKHQRPSRQALLQFVQFVAKECVVVRFRNPHLMGIGRVGIGGGADQLDVAWVRHVKDPHAVVPCRHQQVLSVVFLIGSFVPKRMGIVDAPPFTGASEQYWVGRVGSREDDRPS